MSPDRDSRLQRVRRADWRFLLPRANPERVAVVGEVPADLQQALEETMGNLTRVHVASSATGRFDLVVLSHSGDAGKAAERDGLVRRAFDANFAFY